MLKDVPTGIVKYPRKFASKEAIERVKRAKSDLAIAREELEKAKKLLEEKQESYHSIYEEEISKIGQKASAAGDYLRVGDMMELLGEPMDSTLWLSRPAKV